GGTAGIRADRPETAGPGLLRDDDPRQPPQSRGSEHVQERAAQARPHGPSRSRRTKNNAKAGLSRNSTAGPRPGTLIPGRVMERLWGPFYRASATPRGVPKSGVFGTYPLAARAGVAMALPKRAASALTALGEIPDHRHQART